MLILIEIRQGRTRVGIFWGDDLLDTTQGLDIVGVRGLDQSIELGLVNGITTISQRVRYLSLLTWAIGDFLHENATTGFEEKRLRAFLRRIEFLILASTRVDGEINGSDYTGALGANLHQEAIRDLLDGKPTPVPDDRGGAILGTYFAPSKAVGLLTEGDETIPYKLTVRGKKMWETLNDHMLGSPIRRLLHSGGDLSRSMAEEAIPDLALGALERRPEETDLLKEALMRPWERDGRVPPERVTNAYSAFNETISWSTSLLQSNPDNATGLLVRNYHRCVTGDSQDATSMTWAEYEYRRRCHLCLELLLSSLVHGLDQYEQAAIAQVVERWSNARDLSGYLKDMWPGATMVWDLAAGAVRDSVPSDLFETSSIPTTALRKLPPPDQALAAVAILSGTAMQTRNIRGSGSIDTIPSSPGDQVIDLLENAQDEPFPHLLERLVEIAAISHLQNTLRKMGNGQKCSLRFFPEGPYLRSTGLGMAPGHSGDRLTNVLRFLTDIGTLEKTAAGLVPTDVAPP
jgi:hypothetical protein